MLSYDVANELADRFDLEALPACPLCLFDLACAFDLERPRRTIVGLTTRTAYWVWVEIESEVVATLRRFRMREIPHAEEALADIGERGWRSRLVRVLVERLAQRLADEMRARGDPDGPRTVFVSPPIPFRPAS